MEKVFIPLNPELKEEIENIRFEIQAQQNGVASRSMGQCGYRKNYGVPYHVLKQMAVPYIGNAALANCLWTTGYRETMILATLIQPAEKFTMDKAMQWIEAMPCLEIVEYASMNLYGKLEYLSELTEKLLDDLEHDFALPMAYLSAANMLEKNNLVKELVSKLLNRSMSDLKNNSSDLLGAVAQFLKQLGLYPDYKERVLACVEELSATENMQMKWVAEEVRTFVEYTPSK